jgi:hypothetical protein
MAKDRLVYCGSDVIERDIIEELEMDEYPDGCFVSVSVCADCKVNCPKRLTGYIPPNKDKIRKIANGHNRYTKNWF